MDPVEGGFNDQKAYEQMSGTTVVNITEDLPSCREDLKSGAHNKRLYAPYIGPSSLSVMPGDLLFSKDPDAPRAIVGNSHSGFSSFAGVAMDRNKHLHYVPRGVALTSFAYSTGSGISGRRNVGVTSGVRGVYRVPRNNSGETIYGGKQLVWDIRDPDVIMPPSGRDAPRRKRARCGEDVLAKAFVKQAEPGGMRAEIERLACLYFKDQTPRTTYDLRAYTDAESRPNFDSREKEAALGTIVLPIAVIGLAVVAELVRSGYISWNAVPVPHQPSQPTLNTAANLLGIGPDSQQRTSETVRTIAKMLYYDWAVVAGQGGDGGNHPNVWCDTKPANTLVRSFSSLATSAYVGVFADYSSSFIATAGSTMLSREPGTMIM